MSCDYVPTLGMVRELARAALDAPLEAREPEPLDRCRRRGLIDWRGVITPSGEAVLNRAIAKHRIHEATHG